jgi:hypothetical protein
MVSYIKSALENNFLVELDTFVISVPDGYNLAENCIQVSDMTDSGKKIIVKDELNNILSSERSSGILSFELGSASMKFFKIYSADEKFTDYSSDLSGCSSSAVYTVSISQTQNISSYSEISKFTSNFSNEYDSFKTKYEIPEDIGFSYNFRFADGSFNETAVDESNKNIYAEEFILKYVDKDSNIQTGTLTVKVW